jgi:hypothetical protein
MSVAQEIPVKSPKSPPTSARPNGRWSGYSHLLMARMLELKREPEVVFWVFVFPLLLALGLGIAFRNKPGDAVSVAIISGTGSDEAQNLLTHSTQHDLFKLHVLDAETARQGFRLGKYRDSVSANTMSLLNPMPTAASTTAMIPPAPKACWQKLKSTTRCNLLLAVKTPFPQMQLHLPSPALATSISLSRACLA